MHGTRTWCCVSWPGLGVLTEAWMWDGLWAYCSPWFGVFFVFALKLHAVWSYMLYIVGTQMIYWARFVSFRCSKCIRLEGLFNLSCNNNSKRVLLLVSVFDVMPWNGSSMQGPRMVCSQTKEFCTRVFHGGVTAAGVCIRFGRWSSIEPV